MLNSVRSINSFTSDRSEGHSGSTTNNLSVERGRNTLDARYLDLHERFKILHERFKIFNESIDRNPHLGEAVVGLVQDEQQRELDALVTDLDGLMVMARSGDEDAIELMVQLYVFSKDRGFLELLSTRMEGVYSHQPKRVAEMAEKLALFSLQRKPGSVPDYEFQVHISQNLHNLRDAKLKILSPITLEQTERAAFLWLNAADSGTRKYYADSDEYRDSFAKRDEAQAAHIFIINYCARPRDFAEML